MGQRLRVVSVTAALGEFERLVPPVPQTLPDGVTWEHVGYTDFSYPWRTQTLRARLRAKLPKLFAWELVPGADVYLWADGAFSYQSPDAVAWWLTALGDADIALYRHNERATVAEEAAFLRDVVTTSKGMRVKYGGEDLDGQLAALEDAGHLDTTLYNAGLFAYRNTPAMQVAMRTWWFHISRYHVNDQLSLPFALAAAGARVSVVPGSVYACPVAPRVGRPVRARRA